MITFDNMMNETVLKDLNEERLLKIVEILVDSPKSNIFTWVESSFPKRKELVPEKDVTDDEIFVCLKYYLAELETHLDTLGAFERAIRVSRKIYELGEKYQNFFLKTVRVKELKKIYKCTSVVKNLPRIQHQFWLPLISYAANKLKNQNVADLVCHLYYITCVRLGPLSFRDRHVEFSHWIHAVWAIFNVEEIETTWVDRIFPPSLESDEDLPPCGESVSDEIFIGRRINNLPPRLIKEENKWLEKCFKIWQEDGYM
jgi:hypothetical protein